MKLPLHLKLKKKVHQDIAYAQDIMMEEAYVFFPKAVFHGGTAIWRCYNGNRFSDDIDMYLPTKENIDEFFAQLEKRGFIVLKKRIKNNSLYSLLVFMRVQVRFEALFVKKQTAILREYETVEGTLFNVFTLSASELLDEKIAAFLKRKKIRDLYDIFFLLRYCERGKVLPLKEIMESKIEDKENLSAIILSGPIPTAEEMKRYIESWVK